MTTGNISVGGSDISSLTAAKILDQPPGSIIVIAAAAEASAAVTLDNETKKWLSSLGSKEAENLEVG